MIQKYIIVFLVSMVPLIELRGAIPYASGYNLPLLQSYMTFLSDGLVGSGTE